MLIATPALRAPAQTSAALTLSASSLPLESIGTFTGNQGDRLAGKANQSEAKVRNAVEDVKAKAGMG
ncbi:CsbD family protein [Synechococcus sp. J7-Johnson]|uniref:CsbD family protein n=1 Tax=Synechococcus sp. J7-Johnson TaxID=2823737 RepID=UPI0020CEA055|nr:CsbD family protein [Synechococcus sp. J7-Johnson]